MSLHFLKSIRKYFSTSSYERRASNDLTEIEKKVLEEISIGKSYHTIADELKISNEEVKRIIREIYQKLQKK